MQLHRPALVRFKWERRSSLLSWLLFSCYSAAQFNRSLRRWRPWVLGKLVKRSFLFVLLCNYTASCKQALTHLTRVWRHFSISRKIALLPPFFSFLFLFFLHRLKNAASITVSVGKNSLSVCAVHLRCIIVRLWPAHARLWRAHARLRRAGSGVPRGSGPSWGTLSDDWSGPYPLRMLVDAAQRRCEASAAEADNAWKDADRDRRRRTARASMSDRNQPAQTLPAPFSVLKREVAAACMRRYVMVTHLRSTSSQ
jgi:hypothetical protein